MNRIRRLLLALGLILGLAGGVVAVDAGAAGASAAAYPANGTTITLGNRAIAGTTNSVSCWQVFATGGDSTMSCYRYDQYLNAISNDSYTMPKECSSVAWLTGTSHLAFSYFSYHTDDPTYPHDTGADDWNGWSRGCYGTNQLQNGSQGFYRMHTARTATCDTNTGVVSGCVIVNDGYAGGIWINSAGVLRDTLAGYGGYSWPNGQGVYARVRYTQ